MPKRHYILFLFPIIVAINLTVFLWFNSQTPVVDNGSVLPDDLLESQYAISQIEYDTDINGIRISFDLENELSEDLCITVTNIGEFKAYLFDEEIYAYAPDDIYNRTMIIPLDKDVLNAQGKLQVFFAVDSQGDRPQDLLTLRPLLPAKFLVGTLQNAQYDRSLYFGLAMLSLGIYLLIIMISLIIFFRKPEETYFLLLAGVAAITMIATMFALNISIIHATLNSFRRISPLLAIAPLMADSAIYFYLLSDCVPPLFRRWLTLKNLAIATGLLILIRLLTGRYSFYFEIRLLMLPPIVWTLANAYRNRKKEFIYLFFGYSTGIALVLYPWLVNTFPSITAGLPVMHLQVDQLSHLFTLVFSMMAISHNLADKFKESENLTLELQQLNARLDTLVFQRTQQLREQQDQKHAMMINFFHDLRSPLFILREQLNSMHPIDQDEKDRIKTINKRLQYASKLTEDLFLTAKLESGELIFDFNTIDLNDLLESLCKDNELHAAKKGIAFSYEGTPHSMVWGDSQRLQQAIQNVLDNAFQHTPKGGQVNIRLDKTTKEFHISIQDTGKGIPPENIEKIFERYYRVDKPVQNESSGLGLSIAKAILLEHRGNIHVESSLGKGSTFYITLPLLPEQ